MGLGLVVGSFMHVNHHDDRTVQVLGHLQRPAPGVNRKDGKLLAVVPLGFIEHGSHDLFVPAQGGLHAEDICRLYPVARISKGRLV